MLKGRIGIWSIVLAIALVIMGFVKFINFVSDSPTIYIDSDVSTDSMISSISIHEGIGKYKCILNKETPDIFFSDTIEEKEGYTKYEDIIYSKIVLYVPNAMHNHSSGFVKIPGRQYAYKIDLRSVLTAIETEKEWEDIGVENKVIKGKVTLHIPDKSNAYYDEVVELFRKTLIGNQSLSEDELSTIENRLDSIINKCVKVFDIGQEIYNEYKDPSVNHKIFVGPEYLYQRGSYEMNTGNTDAFVICYVDQEIDFYADMFVKDGNPELTDAFIEYLKNKKEFIYTTGWRVKNSSYNMGDVSLVYKD